MRYIETHHLPGSLNMALDVTLGRLSQKLEEPILRIYSWERPTLSLGRHQKLDDLDLEALEKLDLGCTRRPTGGRAVLHWDEVTYSVVFPKGTDEFKMGVLELYGRISRIIENALRKIGLDVEISSGRGWNPKNPSCFSSSSRYEIKLKGKKVVGSAQMRSSAFVLQHGSILLKPRWDLLSEVLKSHPPVEILSRRATGTGRSFREVADSLIESFDSEYGLRWLSFEETLSLIDEARKEEEGFFCRSST